MGKTKIHWTEGLEWKTASLDDCKEWVDEHMATLTVPLDSWMEDQLHSSALYWIMLDGKCIGYVGVKDGILHFFYVAKAWFQYGVGVFAATVKKMKLNKVFVMTQDTLLGSLLAEWEHTREMQACWFVDGEGNGNVKWPSLAEGELFRLACREDAAAIRAMSGDFFDEVSGGFSGLEDRIDGGTIFVLEEGCQLKGAGIVEKNRMGGRQISIGMFVAREFRRQGVAERILRQLKAWVYLQEMIPVSGCWYYNTLSRSSLERAGMVPVAKGYEAVLLYRDILPLRTGNPPGELVE